MIETAEVMSDNLLANIIVLDVSEQSDYFNYFIIATGLTSQHLESSGNTVTKHLKNLNINRDPCVYLITIRVKTARRSVCHP